LRGEIHQRIELSVMPGKSKSSWHNTAMTILVLASLAMFGTIAYIITLQDLTNSAISYITGLLISVTGILLGLSGLTPASKSLERMKLQVTLTITTLLWLVAVVMIAQTAGPFTFASSSVTLRYLFLVGIALFTVLVVMYSTSTIEATRQRLMAEQVAKSSQPGKATG
jgi:hypothetical protein